MNINEKLRIALAGADDWEWIGGSEQDSHINRWNLVTNYANMPNLVDHCECGHEIVENCWIKSETINIIKTLGNCCIKRFMPAKEDRMKKCAFCKNPHSNRITTLCNDCAKKCCIGHKISLTDGCSGCNNQWIICDICNELHNDYFNCVWLITVDNKEYNWTIKQPEKLYMNYKLNYKNQSYMLKKSKNGKIGIMVTSDFHSDDDHESEKQTIVYYWTIYENLNKMVLEIITQSIISNNFTKYRKWIPTR